MTKQLMRMSEIPLPVMLRSFRVFKSNCSNTNYRLLSALGIDIVLSIRDLVVSQKTLIKFHRLLMAAGSPSEYVFFFTKFFFVKEQVISVSEIDTAIDEITSKINDRRFRKQVSI